MAKPKKSSKRICAVCSTEKSLVDYPSNKATTCIECSTAPVEQGTVDDVVASLIPKTELDYDSPTVQELAARTLARRRLLQFVKRFKPKYMAGWVHEDICRRLERFMLDIEAQKEPRLLLCVPVRHGKSEIGSRHFAPFMLGHHPDWEVIAAAGAQSLALSFSRYIRDLMRDPGYTALFPGTQLDPQSQSVENWNTTAGGGYLAAGIGSMITGRGAHALLIDDPVKDAEAADSQVIRDNTWEWYISTALSRLAPGGGVLIIMTWWNDDDLAGRIQNLANHEGADKFEVVKYPAINDQGDEYILADDSIEQIPAGAPVPEGARMTRPINTALHPERYTLASLNRRKATYFAQGQQRWWSALYQQNPSPEEGAYFAKKTLRYYGTPPQRYQRTVYQAWDFAITEKQTSDWTVAVTMLQDEHDNLSVLDVLRFRSDDGIEIVAAIVDYAIQWQPDLLGFEDGQIWKALAATFAKTCQEKGYYPSHEILQPLTDKKARAQPLRGRMQAGKVFLPKDAPWLAELEKELLRFPNGKHDDQVDALAWAVRLTLSKAAPKLPEPPKMPSWKDRLGTASGETSHMAA